MRENKEKYRSLCSRELSIPLFSQAWWLDAVCGVQGWDVCLVEKGGHVVASLPYTIKSKYTFTSVGQPSLTQTLGPWIKGNNNEKYSKTLANQKDYIQELFRQLPQHDYYMQNWSHQISNWLPVFWLGYQQTTKYTYRIEDLSDINEVYAGFQSNVRTDIKKATHKYSLQVVDDAPIEEFIALNCLTFERQSMKMPYTENYVKQIVSSASKRGQVKWFIARDLEGKNHAGVLLVWDQYSAYYLLGGGDPKLRNSGATSLCMWEAIRFSSTVTKSFDFEGSMIESVERFCRAFGARQYPYFSIFKINSKLLKFAKFLKEVV
ncbi:GNAT family N-acetyltransferase [Vibrio sp. C8]